jgi:hypothetical protein
MELVSLVSMETFTSVYIAAKSLGRISGRIVRTEAGWHPAGRVTVSVSWQPTNCELIRRVIDLRLAPSSDYFR